VSSCVKLNLCVCVVFRTRSLDPHARTNHTMVVALRQAHNHVVMAGESLRHRPVSAGTRQLFLTMFSAGMTPPQALALHRSNLYAEHGDLYQQVDITLLSVLDSVFFWPSISLSVSQQALNGHFLLVVSVVCYDGDLCLREISQNKTIIGLTGSKLDFDLDSSCGLRSIILLHYLTVVMGKIKSQFSSV